MPQKTVPDRSRDPATPIRHAAKPLDILQTTIFAVLCLRGLILLAASAREQGRQLAAMKIRRIETVEQTEPARAIEKAFSRQTVPEPADDQRRADRLAGAAVLFHEDFQQPGDAVNTLRTRHGNGVSELQVAQGLLLPGVLIKNRAHTLQVVLALALA